MVIMLTSNFSIKTPEFMGVKRSVSRIVLGKPKEWCGGIEIICIISLNSMLNEIKHPIPYTNSILDYLGFCSC